MSKEVLGKYGPSHSKLVENVYFTNQLEVYKRPNFKIGDYTYGTPSIAYPSLCKVTIGKYCQIAANVTFSFLMEHPQDRATTYPFPVLHDIWPNAEPYKDDFCFMKNELYIGNEVWIGDNVTILGGSVIGDGAIIGAHSVVKGNVPPYALYVGNRATLKRYRYSPEMIEAFLRIKWWDWPHEKVQEYCGILCRDPKTFVKMFDPIYNKG